MKVLLVNPPRFDGSSVVREERCEVPERYSVLEPYSLLQLGAVLRERGHEVALVDSNGFNLNYRELEARFRRQAFDAMVFRFTPTTFDHDMRAARLAKEVRPDATTVGISWTLRTLPKEVLAEGPAMDIYLRHEYEAVGPTLIDALDEGRPLAEVPGIAFRENSHVAVTRDSPPFPDYDALPLPAYDLLPSLDPYFISARAGQPFTIMYTSRGCPYACNFCTVARTRWKDRSAESVLSELRYLRDHYRIRTVSFFDETFTMSKKRVRAICEGIRQERLELRWYCNTRVHLVDPDLLADMRSAGCSGISFGVESGNQKILDGASKQATVGQAEAAIRSAKAAGIKVYCAFILGLPGETRESAMDTIHFALRTLPNGAQFNVLAPYPGTQLHEELREQGLLPQTTDWRTMYQDRAALGTKDLSPEALNRLRQLAYASLYFSPRWWLQNLRFAFASAVDFQLASRYAVRVLNNYFVHGMRNSH
jgi:anaerobic magnesium-protoporphyrin IX monomethyl ester cyclase